MVRLEYAPWLVRRHISTCTERFVKIQLFEENPLFLSLPFSVARFPGAIHVHDNGFL